MSERFPSIRHLAGYVESQLTQFQQLKMAVDEVLTSLDLLEDRRRQLADCESKITDTQARWRETKESYDHFVANLTEQRQAVQALLTKEQQQRVQARDDFDAQRREWQEERTEMAAVLQQLEQEITAKREELDRLRESLEATVNAALGKR